MLSWVNLHSLCCVCCFEWVVVYFLVRLGGKVGGDGSLVQERINWGRRYEGRKRGKGNVGEEMKKKKGKMNLFIKSIQNRLTEKPVRFENRFFSQIGSILVQGFP